MTKLPKFTSQVRILSSKLVKYTTVAPKRTRAIAIPSARSTPPPAALVEKPLSRLLLLDQVLLVEPGVLKDTCLTPRFSIF
jgi:hypothetical protein